MCAGYSVAKRSADPHGSRTRMAHGLSTCDHSAAPSGLETLGIFSESEENLGPHIEQLVQENVSGTMVSEEVPSTDLNCLNSVSLQDACHERPWQGGEKPVESERLESKEIPADPLAFPNDASVLKTHGCGTDLVPALQNVCSFTAYSDVSSCSDLDSISNTLIEENLQDTPSSECMKTVTNKETNDLERDSSTFTHAGDLCSSLTASDIDSETKQDGDSENPPEAKDETGSNLHDVDCSSNDDHCLNVSNKEDGNRCTLENIEQPEKQEVPQQNSDCNVEETSKACEDTVTTRVTSVCSLDLNSLEKTGDDDDINSGDVPDQGGCPVEEVGKACEPKFDFETGAKPDIEKADCENETKCDRADDNCITERSSFEFLQSCFGFKTTEQVPPLLSSLDHQKVDVELNPSECEVHSPSQNCNSNLLSSQILQKATTEPVHEDQIKRVPNVQESRISHAANRPHVSSDPEHQSKSIETGVSRDSERTKSDVSLLSSQKLVKKMQPVVLLQSSGQNVKDGEVYHCSECQQNTASSDELIEHYHCKHPQHQFQYCLTCRRYFSSVALSKKHSCGQITLKELLAKSLSSTKEVTTKEKEIYTCRYCHKLFVKRPYFIEHERRHREVTQYRCGSCGLYFLNAMRLHSHKRKVKCPPLVVDPHKHGKKRSEIDLKESKETVTLGTDGCQMKLKDCFVKLVDIKKMDPPPQQINCPVCGKGFKLRAQLNGHLRTHTDKKHFQCDTCKKYFKYSWNLNKHKREQCSAKKVQVCESSVPEEKRTGKYECPICPRKFKHSYNRTRHLRVMCLKEYTRLGKGKVGNRYKCPLCSETFSLSCNRSRHIKNTCFEQYKLKRNVNKVKRVKGESGVKHEKEENQVLPSQDLERYKCTLCPAVFSHKSGVYRHMKRRHKLLQNTEILTSKPSNTSDLMPSSPKKQGSQTLVSTVKVCSDSLSCRFCERVFNSSYALKTHLKIHRGSKPFRCLDCGKNFGRRGHLLAHKNLHRRRIQCAVCKKILPSLGDLLKHRQSHLTKGMLKCPDCPMQFKFPVFLLRHVRTHEKQHQAKSNQTAYDHEATDVKVEEIHEEFKCALCQKAFVDSKALSEHCLTHMPKPSVSRCQYCKQQFHSRAVLIRHIRLHTGEKPYSCLKCGMHFYRSEYLKGHEEKCKMTRKEPPPPAPKKTQKPEKCKKVKTYKCSYCPHVFTIFNCWKVHERAHLTKTIFPCLKCGKYYRTRNIKDHKKVCKDSEFQLPFSDYEAADNRKNINVREMKSQGTDSAIASKSHRDIRTNIQDTQRCPHCSKRFRYRSLLLRHLNTHFNRKEFVCMHCGQKYASQQYYLQHEAICDGVLGQYKAKVMNESDKNLEDAGVILGDNEELKCTFCTKTFTTPRNLRRHILTHTEVKPYRCKTCESCFSRYDHLKLHQTRCKGKRQRLEVRIEKITLDHVGTGWQTKTQPQNGVFVCNICSKQFLTHTNLTRHISMLHTTIKPFLCKKCGNSYSSKKSLRRHVLMVDCERPSGEHTKPARSSPPAQYSSESSKLLQRIQGHYSSKWKFQCEYCPRRFKNQAQLKVHTRLHTGEKPFGCDGCGERFIRRDYLQRHLAKCNAIGDGLQKVLCDRCGGLFAQDVLHKHQKNCVVNVKLADRTQSAVGTCSPPKVRGFSCVSCSDRFLLFSQLQQHFLTKHRSDGLVESDNLENPHLSSTLNIKEEPLDEGYDVNVPSTNQMHATNRNEKTGGEMEKPFECQKCNMRFVTTSGLGMHLRAHTAAYTYSCKKCNKGFWSKNVYQKHSKKCKGQDVAAKTEMNQECPTSSDTEFAINDTVLVFNKGCKTTGTGVLQTKFSCKDQDKGRKDKGDVVVNKYQCSECDQTFTDGLKLISHLEDHGREDLARRLGKHQCTLCDKSFDYAAMLQRHIKTQHQEPVKNRCPECFRSFRCPSDLDIHRSCHDPNRPFVCGTCQLRFWTAKSLSIHQRLAHIEASSPKADMSVQVYTCYPCNKSYTIKNSYIRHCRIKHNGVLNSPNTKGVPQNQQVDRDESDTNDAANEDTSDDDSDSAPYFPCHVCGKTFLTSESLEDHQRCHLGEKPYECEECGKCFFHLTNLQHHQRSHKSEFQCPMCGKGFISLFALRKHKHTHVKKRPHRCTKCHLSFTGSSQLAEHMITHRDENFPCDLCNKTFSCKSSRAEHRKSHTEQEDELPPLVPPSKSSPPPVPKNSFSVSHVQQYNFHCGICQEHFPNAEQLSEHGCDAANERPYSCPECNKHFLHGSHLKKHQLSHQLSGPRSFQCNSCHMSFSHRHLFLTHLRTHENESSDTPMPKKAKKRSTNDLKRDKIYTCPICPESFSQALELANHLSVHAHMCNVCNKTFATKKQLDEHEKCHLSAATQYECTECGNSFLGSDAFRQHHCARKKQLFSEKSFAHSSQSPPYKKKSGTSFKIIDNEEEEEEVDVGEDFYNCPICNKRFSSSISLQEHKKLHEDDRPFKCLVCGKGFAKKKYLTQHQQTHSEQPYQCDSCSESFKTEHSLLCHQKTHNVSEKHQCSLCQKSYRTASDLLKHERKHPELQNLSKESGEHRCDMCYKSFGLLSQLRKHQETHVGQVVYECTECDKAFAFLHLLEEHQQTHSAVIDSL